MADMASLQATIRGRVQGVFFRAYVEAAAERLNLTGYVRNQPGGVVEVRAEGEKPNLEKMVEALKRRGISVEYILKENEGHGYFRDEKNRMELWRAIETFLEKNIGRK